MNDRIQTREERAQQAARQRQEYIVRRAVSVIVPLVALFVFVTAASLMVTLL